MKIQCKYDALLPIEAVRPNPDNPNTHPSVQLKGLQVTIKENEIRHPLIISNNSGLLVAGHARFLVMKDLGMKEVPVVYQDFESTEKEYQFMVADNESQRKSWFNPIKFNQSIKKFGIQKINREAMGIYDSIIKLDYGQLDDSKDDDDDGDPMTEIQEGQDLTGKSAEAKQVTCPKCGFRF